VLVTTYQAGRLVILRNDGGVLNTHFRLFPKPMGLAVSPNRLAIGCETNVREFHNVPAVGAKLDPPERHNACFLPRAQQCPRSRRRKREVPHQSLKASRVRTRTFG
jgi:hypothetical protein